MRPWKELREIAYVDHKIVYGNREVIDKTEVLIKKIQSEYKLRVNHLRMMRLNREEFTEVKALGTCSDMGKKFAKE